MYFQDGSLCWSPFGAPWWEEFWERHYLWKSVNPSVFYKLRHVRFEQFLAIEFKQIDRFLNGVSPRRTKSVFKNKALSWKYTSLIKNFLRDNRFSYSIVAKPFRFQSLPCKTALDAYFRHTLFWLLMLKTLSNMPAQIRQKMLKCHLFGWFLNFCTKMAPLAKKS